MPNLYRNEKNKNSKNKKIDFKTYKKNTLNSLNDVEYFLRNFTKISKHIRLYKSFKK